MSSTRLPRPVPVPAETALDDPSHLGNILLRMGKIKREQLWQAIDHQARFEKCPIAIAIKTIAGIEDADLELAMKLQAKMQGANPVDAEMTVLEAKLDESGAHAQELAECLAAAKDRRKRRAARGPVRLVPARARS
jgi:hypothetical protein